MSTEFFIGGIPESTIAEELRDFLGKYRVRSIRVFPERRFGFVTTYTKNDSLYVSTLDNARFNGAIIRVVLSKKNKSINLASRFDNILVEKIEVGIWKASKNRKNLLLVKEFPGPLPRERNLQDFSFRDVNYSHLHGKKDLFFDLKIQRIKVKIVHGRKMYFILLNMDSFRKIFFCEGKLIIEMNKEAMPIILERKTEGNFNFLNEREIRSVDFSNDFLLENFNVLVLTINLEYWFDVKFHLKKIYGSLNRHIKDVKYTRMGFQLLQEIELKIRDHFSNPFIGYLLKCCMSEGILNPFFMNEDFFDEMRKEEEAAIEFLNELYSQFYNTSNYDYDSHYMKFYNKKVSCVDKPLDFFLEWINEWKIAQKKREIYGDDIGGEKNYNNKLFAIKRILITPLKTYFLPEEFDVGNLVLRKYKKYIKNFVRVSFVDEESREERMRYSDPIGVRVKRILLNGIKVGRYWFKFLAFSNSQLRRYSFWMFHEVGEVTCQSIRAWMGDFSDIKNLAKYCARLGQCLSTTRSSVTIKPDEFLVIDDIERTNSLGYHHVFTDGCGMIGESVARKIVKKLNLRGYRDHNLFPGAFQIRFNGAKGVVAVYPESRMGGKKLLLRKSMMKFKSKLYDLGICTHSSFLPCYLNRQIIALLSTRGVEDRVFLELQHSMVKMLDDMFKDVSIAIKVLSKFSSPNDLSIMLTQLLKAGFQLDNSFIVGCLRSISKYKRLDLKQKSKIYVEKGALMIGVCDESKKLRYGEVFVQTRQKKEERIENYVHEGYVSICKNPAFHPGDIRVLKAVDIPELRHLANVIVFPVNGNRPHPNEISGSDLDGDIYFVCWERELIPLTPNFGAMRYDPPQLRESVEEFTVQDISLFFLDSMKNDQIGRIANSHLAHYAFSEFSKCKSTKCVELAKLHSIAVDFPKTGVVAKLKPDLIPQKYPLFMEKGSYKHSERSRCVIEKLYEQITHHGEDTLLPKITDLDDVLDDTLVIEGHEKYLSRAEDFSRRFSKEVIRMMKKFKVTSESDLFSFLFIKYNNKILPERQMREAKESVGALVTTYKAFFRKDELIKIEMYKKASAWYVASFKNRKVNRHDRRNVGFTIRGFPFFTCWKYLCDIKNGKHLRITKKKKDKRRKVVKNE